MTAPVIRPLTEVEEFEACVALQASVWGFADRDLVPRRMFSVAHKIGGQVLGAWSGATLAGFTLAIPGVRDGKIYWHSHMLAVGQEFRNQGLGRRLKLFQRDEALARGIELMEWTFDPLEIMNGYFNLGVLGAVVQRYLPNFYGITSSALQAGLPTDRLSAEWWLRSPRVEAVAAGGATPEGAITATVKVPAEIHAWKNAGDPRALATQSLIRELLTTGFAAGKTAIGYRRDASGGCFLLGKL
ncbi:MAG TPA: GNAT family N-acetyltransferase [Terriglobales bacterium]|nr:GNAT family N-acetyltransferase [Terriglobales bacterium]